MKIISKFRDYYDGYANYSNEDVKVKVWVRKEEDIEISKYKLVVLEEKKMRTSLNYEAGYIIIAGKVYPFVSHYKDGGWKWIDGIYSYIGSKTDYFFDTKSLKEERKDYQNEKSKYWRYDTFGDRNLNNFFNTEYPDMTDLCIEYDTPIIAIRPESSQYKNGIKTFRTCYKNINLKEHGLTKLFTAPEIYQIIDVFVSNVLVKDEMPISEMTDAEKIQSHGFDKKTSFRKGK